MSNGSAALAEVPLTATVDSSDATTMTRAGTPIDQSLLVKQVAMRFRQIQGELNSFYIEREEVIRGLLLAIAVGEHILVLGPPGAAKSAIAKSVCSHIQAANYFEYQMNENTEPANLVGPYSIKKLEQDRFSRVSTRMLPEAHIAYIDEPYRSNSACLNFMLSIMEERVWYDDGMPHKVPLISMIGTSNEGPDDPTLEAFHDRFLFRYIVDYIADPNNLGKMLASATTGRYVPRTIVTLDDIQLLRNATKNCSVPDTVFSQLARTVFTLRGKGITVSDRRIVKAVQVLQAAAVLRGRSVAATADFIYLVSLFWNREEEIPEVQKLLGEKADPLTQRIKDLTNKIDVAWSELENTPSNTRVETAVKTEVQLDTALKVIEQLARAAVDLHADPTPIIDLQAQVQDLKARLKKDFLGASVDPSIMALMEGLPSNLDDPAWQKSEW